MKAASPGIPSRPLSFPVGRNSGDFCTGKSGLSAPVHLLSVMRLAFAVDIEHDSLCVWLRSRVPAVDLCQDGFHFGIAQLVFGVPPIKRVQRLIEQVLRLFCFGNQTQSKLMYKPRFG